MDTCIELQSRHGHSRSNPTNLVERVIGHKLHAALAEFRAMVCISAPAVRPGVFHVCQRRLVVVIAEVASEDAASVQELHVGIYIRSACAAPQGPLVSKVDHLEQAHGCLSQTGNCCKATRSVCITCRAFVGLAFARIFFCFAYMSHRVSRRVWCGPNT